MLLPCHGHQRGLICGHVQLYVPVKGTCLRALHIETAMTMLCCRERTVSQNGQVILDMNVAGRNHGTAYLTICLAIFLIVELSVFSLVLKRTAAQLLLQPVNRILALLQGNAAKVVQSLDKDQARQLGCGRASGTLFPLQSSPTFCIPAAMASACNDGRMIKLVAMMIMISTIVIVCKY